MSSDLQPEAHARTALGPRQDVNWRKDERRGKPRRTGNRGRRGMTISSNTVAGSSSLSHSRRRLQPMDASLQYYKRKIKRAAKEVGINQRRWRKDHEVIQLCSIVSGVQGSNLDKVLYILSGFRTRLSHKSHNGSWRLLEDPL